MKRSASAIWHGNLKGGKGTLSTDSGVLKQSAYSYGTRFENGIGTNPEELIAAAHAGCFTMALSAGLQEAGFTAESLETKATVTLENGTITGSHLVTIARVPGASAEQFAKAAAGAKANCPVSRALHLTITLDAKLA